MSKYLIVLCDHYRKVKWEDDIMMIGASVDFSKINGRIKPLHGVNNAPEPDCESGYCNVLQNAGIPFVRLHDMGGHYAAARYVDIANVFPNFDSDPSDPESYDFSFTDFH